MMLTPLILKGGDKLKGITKVLVLLLCTFTCLVGHPIRADVNQGQSINETVSITFIENPNLPKPYVPGGPATDSPQLSRPLTPGDNQTGGQTGLAQHASGILPNTGMAFSELSFGVVSLGLTILLLCLILMRKKRQKDTA